MPMMTFDERMAKFYELRARLGKLGIPEEKRNGWITQALGCNKQYVYFWRMKNPTRMISEAKLQWLETAILKAEEELDTKANSISL